MPSQTSSQEVNVDATIAFGLLFTATFFLILSFVFNSSYIQGIMLCMAIACYIFFIPMGYWYFKGLKYGPCPIPQEHD